MEEKNKIGTNYLLVDPVLGTGVGDAERGSRSNSGIRQIWAWIWHKSNCELLNLSKAQHPDLWNGEHPTYFHSYWDIREREDIWQSLTDVGAPEIPAPTTSWDLWFTWW